MRSVLHPQLNGDASRAALRVLLGTLKSRARCTAAVSRRLSEACRRKSRRAGGGSVFRVEGRVTGLRIAAKLPNWTLELTIAVGRAFANPCGQSRPIGRHGGPLRL